MNGSCLTGSLLYYTTISREENNFIKSYEAICETTYKKHYGNQKKINVEI